MCLERGFAFCQPARGTERRGRCSTAAVGDNDVYRRVPAHRHPPSPRRHPVWTMTSDDDDEVAVLVAHHHRLTILRLLRRRRLMSRITRRRRGSLPGRRPNKNRDFSLGLQSIIRDYFGVSGHEPIYDETDFERRFRVPRVVFMRIFNDIKHEPWWEQRPNATGRLQAHPLQKQVGAFRR